MPFNLQVQDQSPALDLAGARGLGYGIEQFGAGLGRFLETLGKKKEQDKQEAKLTVSLRKTLKDLDAAQALKEGREPNPHVFDNMGPDDVRGTMEGVMLKSRLDREGAALEHYKKMNVASDREEARARAFPMFARMAGELGQTPESVPSPTSNVEFDRRTAPVTQQSILRTMGEAGYDPGAQNFDDIMRAFMPKAKEGWGLQPNEEIDLGGGRRGVAVSPNSLQVIPPEKPAISPGEGPRKSKDGKFYWDEKNMQWKPIHEGTLEGFMKALNTLPGSGAAAGGGGRAAGPAPGAAPTLRFRKGANGEVEQY